MRIQRTWTAAAVAIFVAATTGTGFGQGCVAAHSNQRSMDELVRSFDGGTRYGWSIHNLTVDIGYRFFNSNKYFIGDAEIARPNAIRNHQNIFDIGVEYRFTPQWSFIADVPVFNGTRNQLYSPTGIFQVSGLGDITLGAQRWIFRGPTEFGGNVAVSASVKIPTGINNATGSALYKGQVVKATADQSMQPGDGGWGLSLGAQGYKSIWRRADLYGQAQYLFNPRDTNGGGDLQKPAGAGRDVGDGPVSVSAGCVAGCAEASRGGAESRREGRRSSGAGSVRRQQWISSSGQCDLAGPGADGECAPDDFVGERSLGVAERQAAERAGVGQQHEERRCVLRRLHSDYWAFSSLLIADANRDL